MKLTKESLAQEIKSAVRWLQENEEGCSTIKLNDRLAVCVGWSDGYDESDQSVIHSKTGPSWCINAGIKVWTSDDLRTDYEWINAPFYENGDVLDTNISISPHEDYNILADWFIKEYETLSKFNIQPNGQII